MSLKEVNEGPVLVFIRQRIFQEERTILRIKGTSGKITKQTKKYQSNFYLFTKGSFAPELYSNYMKPLLV